MESRSPNTQRASSRLAACRRQSTPGHMGLSGAHEHRTDSAAWRWQRSCTHDGGEAARSHNDTRHTTYRHTHRRHRLSYLYDAEPPAIQLSAINL